MNQMFSTTIPAARPISAPAQPAAAPPIIDDRTAGLRELVEMLLRRKTWIIVTALVFTVIGALYAFSRPREYVATARVLIDPRGLQVVDRDLTARIESPDGGVAEVESQLRVMISEGILSKVIDREGLLDDPEFNGDTFNPLGYLRSAIGSLLGAGESRSDPRIAVLDVLSDAVRAGRPERSYVIELSVRTRDAEKSARIANAIVAVYMESEVAVRAGLARRASTSLESRLDELRATLRVSEDRVERYKAENNIVDADGRLVNEQQLAELNTRLSEAQARTSTALARLEQVRAFAAAGGNPDTLPEAVLSDTIRQLRMQYAAARQREVAQSARLLPGHPLMQQTTAQVASLRDEIASELGRIAAGAQAEYDRALSNQNDLAAELEALKRAAYSTNDAMIRLRELEREVEANRVVYESFLVRARELSEQEQVDTAIARVIAEAGPPLGPSGPGNALILALAAAAGLGLGGLLALGRDAMDPTIRQPRQIEEATGLRVLATMPVMANVDDGTLPAFVARFPASPSAAALYLARERLRQMPCVGYPRTVLITSTGHNDGKTTVALNLALASAIKGDRVLLIDGDLARRTLSVARYGEPEIGLTGVVNGEVRLKDAFVTDRSGLISALPAGRRSSRLLAGKLTGENLLYSVIGGLEDFDLVVVDAGAATMDGGIGPFADIADSIVLVARNEETTMRQLASAIRVIGPTWTRMSGVVLVSDG